MDRTTKWLLTLLILLGLINLSDGVLNQPPVEAASVSRQGFTIVSPGTTPACPAGSTQVLTDQNTSVTYAPLTALTTTSIAPITSMATTAMPSEDFKDNVGTQRHAFSAAVIPREANGNQYAFAQTGTNDVNANATTNYANSASTTSYTVVNGGTTTSYTWHYRVCTVP